MAQTRTLKTSFTAGELAPELLGRPDLRASANGARRLRNVVIQPTGGVTRRPGLRHIADLPGPARLIAFEFNTEQAYLLALTDGQLRVFLADGQVAQLNAPWTTAMLPQIAHTQSADTLLLAHPGMPVQRVTRTGHTSWTIGPWTLVQQPFFRWGDSSVTLTPTAAAGNIFVAASAPAFVPDHVGVRFRIRGRRMLCNQVVSASQAGMTIEEPLPDTNPTADWEEEAHSRVRGWPVSLCFHQDRLVIGGSRDLPNRLWMSHSGSFFDFGLGEGKDSEGIEFGIVSDQVNAIRGLFSGQHLQVFTSGAEWQVTGVPLTPANIQLNRQTRVGSPVVRHVPPVDVDGSTIFTARTGRGLFEFTYTDAQQAYQASDLALVARHLVVDPVSVCYDQLRRLLHVAMADGTLATLTLYRAEQVTAWTRQETDGAVRALAEVEGTVWAAVERFGSHRLERFDDTLHLDAALTGTAAAPEDRWTGLSHLEGRTVAVLAEGAPRGPATVRGGAVLVDPPARDVQIGLAYRHVIEPLPPDMTAALGTRAAPLRLVSVTFRLLDTAALSVDLGRGAAPVSFRRLGQPLLDAAPVRFTGDVRLRALGWRRDALASLWRIEDDAALPMTLLSVTTDMRITD